MKKDFKARLISLGIALLATSTAHAATATDTSFSTSQKTAIEQVVHDYLLSHPEVLLEAAHSLQQKQHAIMNQQAKAAISKNAAALFADANSPVIGNPKADVTVVEFFDFQCPYCKHMAPVITDLLKQDPNVRIVFKQLPIFGEQSEFAAKAALAAAKQNKYLAFNNALLQAKIPFTQDEILDTAKSVNLDISKLQTDMQNSAFADELSANQALANELGLVGTPAFVISKVSVTHNKISKEPTNNIFLPNAVTLSMLQQAIREARG